MNRNETTMKQQNPEDEDSGYGWFSFKPRYLQSCLSPKWILVCLCLLAMIEGFIVSGLTGIVITSLEKRYFLRSSQVGGIFACYEAGAATFVLLVSYYGHHHKPRWLGIGTFIMGLGCLIFALPQLMIGEYKPIVAGTSDLCQIELVSNVTDAKEKECRSSGWYYLIVFTLGQLLIGAGASPIYSLGSTYIDENVSRKNAGIFLGIYYSTATLGLGLGYILGGYFLTIYVDITPPDGIELNQEDNSWIGAWWLGYVAAGIGAMVISLPFYGFPRQTTRARHLSYEKKKATDSVPDDERPHTTKALLPALRSILTNKVFLLATAAGTADMIALSGSGTFFPKVLESQFHLTSSRASIFAGTVLIPGGIIGMILGGYLVRRFQWTCGQCIRACVVISCFAMFTILILLVHCPNRDLVGVTVPYINRTDYGSPDVCSAKHNCSCNPNKYIPICTKEDQMTYFSPCHAGCKVETTQGDEKIYKNCSCLPSNITIAYEGGCVKPCNTLGFFLAVVFLMILITVSANVPYVTVILRCVPQSKGSFALGVQQVIVRVLALIPAPIIYGALLDSVCILSETDPCKDVDRNCLEYKNEGMSYVLLSAGLGCKGVALLFYCLTWWTYEPPKVQEENHIEMHKNGTETGKNGNGGKFVHTGTEANRNLTYV